MNEKRIIEIKKGPKPVVGAPYSQAVGFGNLLFISGQIGIDPQTGKLVGEEVEAQVRQALENLKFHLEDSGSSLGKVLKTTVYLVDMADFGKMNEIYKVYFGEKPPARATVQAAKLPLNAKFEIEAIAHD